MTKGKKVKNKKDTQKKICNDAEKKEKCKYEDNASDAKTHSQNTTNTDTLSNIFRGDELHELRKILNVQDLTNMPLIFGAVILGKFDVVKRLLKDNHHHINSYTTDHSTPIMWAVKNKNLEMIDLLLARGADVAMTDKNGDNAVLLAADNPNWDEDTFIGFWNNIIKNRRFNINYSNKAGNTLLHLAVKKQWCNMAELLIKKKVKINCANAKGITPLMMAGARNNDKLVDVLLQAGADITLEDNRGCTVLCYMIAYIIQKRIEPTSTSALEKIISVINADNSELSHEDYLKRRIDLIITPPNNQAIEFSRVIATVTLPILTFFIHYTQTGLESLLDLNIFTKLREAVDKHIECPEYVNAILSCLFELVRYCKCCVGGGHSKVSETKLIDTFILNGGAEICVCILKRYNTTPNNGWIVVSALMPLFIACVSEGKARVWLQLHYRELLPFYQQFLEMCVISYNIIGDEYHVKLVKRKIRAFRGLMKKLQNDEHKPNKKKYEKKSDSSPSKTQHLNDSHTKEKSESNSPKSKCVSKDSIDNDPQRKLVTLDKYLSSTNQDNQKNDNKSNSKRMKRKTKAWKAKVAKMRSANLAERVVSKTNSNSDIKKADSKKNNEIKISSELSTNSSITINKAEATINNNESKNNDNNSDLNTEWNKMIVHNNKINNEQLNESNFKDTIKIDIKLEHDSSSEGIVSDDENEDHQINPSLDLFPSNTHYINDEIEVALASKFQYLTLLFEDIVKRYEKNWQNDRELGYPDFQTSQTSSSDDIFHGTREEQIQQLTEVLPHLEQLYLTRLREKFTEVLSRIKQAAYNQNGQHEKLIEELQSTLLNHEIRGETALTSGSSNLFETDAILSDSWGKCNDQNSVNMEQYAKDQDDEYMRQIMNLPQTKQKCQSEIDEAKQKTDECSYHLVDSIMKILDSSSSASSTDDSEKEMNFDELFPYSAEPSTIEDTRNSQKISNTTVDITQSQILSVTKINHDTCVNNFFNILSHNKIKKVKSMEVHNNTCINSCLPSSNLKYQQSPPSLVSIPPQISNNTLWEKSQMPVPIPGQHSYISRWEVAVTNLRNYKNLTVLACGELRTSSLNDRMHFLVSSGGNFGNVELGLDSHNRALAVKRIPKQNSLVCKLLKSAMNPLLGLRHKHLLHYAICDYDDVELLIASPLCEYNMGEYLMYLKLNHSLTNTTTSLAKQLLIGLHYLHERTLPIVHGNLKPSNVLIDSAGILKLAEFGVYRALYQAVRPPKSSIIWFARETYEHYEKTSSMSCTTHSDIQVAGMLLHFILTGGLHPFGIVAENILENIVRGTPDLKTAGCELIDLISWMLIYEPFERPTVSQVLSHVYFWDTEKKWRFLLACAGITQHGSPIPISLSHLHQTLDATAARDHIKGDWVSVVKSKLPGLRFPSGTFSDTPTGLLRFLRACTEERQLNNRSLGGIDLQSFFIEAFPALPLSLYRLLETTEWLKHPVFSPFTSIAS